MDDGRRLIGSPVPHPTPSIEAIDGPRKAQSLPGYYCRRPISPPQTFRDAFATSYGPPFVAQASTPGTPHPKSSHGNRGKGERAPVASPASTSRPPEKKSRRILGGLFRRRKSGSPSTTSSEGDSDGLRRRFFARRTRNKKCHTKQPQPSAQPEGSYPPPPPRDTVALNMSAHHFRSQTTYLLTTDTGKVLKMSPSGSLGREVSRSHYNNLDGGPYPQSPASVVGRGSGASSSTQSLSAWRPAGVSASHDSLVESAYGSINSSLRSSALGERSSSTDTLTRKERREALKARVELLRERSRGAGGSSSDEGELGSLSSQFGSETSLTKGDDGLRKTRSSRTERYIRRKAQELETLRVETEKDRRNREAVQARILEIQKSQRGRNEGAHDKPKHPPAYHNGRHTPNPPENPVASPRTPSRQQYVVKRLSNVSVPRQTFTYTQGGRAPSSLDATYLAGRGTADGNSGHLAPYPTFSETGSHHRSLSYDNHINKVASVLPQYYTSKVSCQEQFTPGIRVLNPPVPPPRGKSSSYLSSYDHTTNRPMSYSFENLHKDPTQVYDGVSPFRGTAPVPPTRGELIPPVTSCRRSLSDRQLHLSDGGIQYQYPAPVTQGYSSLPTRPALPKIYNDVLQGPIPVSTPLPSRLSPLCIPCYSPLTSSSCFGGGVAPTPTPLEKRVGTVPFLGVAPSPPYSDYSSYVSDHSSQKAPQQQLSQPLQTPLFPGEDKSPSLRKSLVPRETSPLSSAKSHSFPAPAKRRAEEVPLSIPSRKGGDISLPSEPPPPPHLQADRGAVEDSNPCGHSPTKRRPNARPLSMVPEKFGESGEKESLGDRKPQPPKRNSSQDYLKQHLDDPGQCQKFREFYLKEKERLQQENSTNFEDALKELESIYQSLNLGAEVLSCGSHGNWDAEEGGPRTPDKIRDDMHLRRVNLSNQNSQSMTKGTEITGSYLLVSPVHGPPSVDYSDPSGDPEEKEPDIVNDDVTVRSVQMANAIKILDPQPPFGIPVGPVTQGARSDYLNAPPKTSGESSTAGEGLSKEPDVVFDDMAFRSLRKDGVGVTVLEGIPDRGPPSRSASTKAVNTSDLDELLLEVREPRALSRSRSVPRSTSVDRGSMLDGVGSWGGSKRSSETSAQMKTPRQLKQHQKAKKGGSSSCFYDSFKDALTDTEAGRGGTSTPSFLGGMSKPPSSWVERASFEGATSTETLAETQSQMDIRHTIIRASRFPAAEKRDTGEEEDDDDRPNPFQDLQEDIGLIIPVPPLSPPPPQSLEGVPVQEECRRGRDDWRPDMKQVSPVNIARLDYLISSLSELEPDTQLPEETETEDLPTENLKKEGGAAVPDNKDKLPDTTNLDFEQAKANIQNAIRQSMAVVVATSGAAATPSSSGEGNHSTLGGSRRRSSNVDPSGTPLSLPLPSPLVLSRPQTVMSMNITSKHFPSPSTAELVVVPPCEGEVPRPSLEHIPSSESNSTAGAAPLRASTKTHRVAAMVSSSELILEGGKHPRPALRRAKSVPPSPSPLATPAVPAQLSSSSSSSSKRTRKRRKSSSSSSSSSSSRARRVSAPVTFQSTPGDSRPAGEGETSSSLIPLSFPSSPSSTSSSSLTEEREEPAPPPGDDLLSPGRLVPSGRSSEISDGRGSSSASRLHKGSSPSRAVPPPSSPLERESDKRKRRLEYEKRRLQTWEKRKSPLERGEKEPGGGKKIGKKEEEEEKKQKQDPRGEERRKLERKTPNLAPPHREAKSVDSNSHQDNARLSEGPPRPLTTTRGPSHTNSKEGKCVPLKPVKTSQPEEKTCNAFPSVTQRLQLSLQESDSPRVEPNQTPALKNSRQSSPESTMVQERRPIRGDEGTVHQGDKPLPSSGTPTTGPVLKPIRGSVPSPGEVSGESADKAEQEKRERIQRYKDERRRQMAARYGTKEASSSDDDNLQTSSETAYRRKRRPRSGLGSYNDMNMADVRRSQGTEASADLLNKGDDGPPVPVEDQTVSPGSLLQRLSSITTTTTTLTTTAQPTSANNHSLYNNNDEGTAQDDAQPGHIKEPFSDPTALRSQPLDGRIDSADSTPSGSEGRPGVRRRSSGEDRDKSHKRKSHLNRASTSEEAVYPPAPLSHLSDSSEEVPRRRRRRNPQGLSDSPHTSSPNTTPPDATPRATPLGAFPSAVARSDIPGHTETPNTQGGTLPPIIPVSLLRGTSHPSAGITSAPATLDTRYCVEKGDGVISTLVKGTLHKQPLRKPDIPEVLRPRDPNTPSGLTSPGVVLSHKQLRPTSVVMEKPPLGPEGVGARPSSLKSSLRKAPETGTCFLSAKREQKDEEDDSGRRNGAEPPMGDSLGNLTTRALHLKSRVEALSGDSMVLECEQYLKENKDPPTPRGHPNRDGIKGGTHSPPPGHLAVSSASTAADRGGASDSGQKNWLGGPEDIGDKVSRRLVFQDEMRGPSSPPNHAEAAPGPPYNTHSSRKDDEGGGGPSALKVECESSSSIFESRSLPVTRRRSYSAKEDLERSSSAQGILKKSSCPPHGSCRIGGSFDASAMGGAADPRPILKKKSSVDEEAGPPFSDPRKKSILKKKSLTDDELEWDRPRSILKGARSREDLMDHKGEASGCLSPVPILKRGSRDTTLDIDGGGELRPILKRRDTTDGVRSVLLKSSGGTDPSGLGERGEPILVRRDSAPLPFHGILKRRPSSPAFDALATPTGGDRSLSVAERVAGMEAMHGAGSEALQGAKPKVRSRPSSGERPISPLLLDREVRRSSWIPSSSNHTVGPEGDAPMLRLHSEAFNPLFGQATSRVSQKAAFFAKLEQEKNITPPLSPSLSSLAKRERGMRFATQPITEGEVTKAAQLLDNPSGHDVENNGQESATPSCVSSVLQEGITTSKLPVESLSNIGRRMSVQELGYEEDAFGHREAVRGILKTDPASWDRLKDSPRSILKADSRKSSISEGEQHPRGILKSESPMSSTKGSPEHDPRSLRSVLKKDSSVEDAKEIKSILKPESQSLDPEISSDSSSETVIQTVNHSLVEAFSGPITTVLPAASFHGPSDGEYVSRRSSMTQQVLQEAVKQAQPMKAKDNLAEALRQIEPIGRDKSREREKDAGEASHVGRILTKEEVISNIREKSLKGAEENAAGGLLLPFPAIERRVEALTSSGFERRTEETEHTTNGLPKSTGYNEEGADKYDEESNSEIDEMKACFKQSMKSLSGLCQEELRASKERVTLRQKTRQLKVATHTDRWTLNDFSSCRTAMDSSPVRSSPSSDSSSSPCSSSPVGPRKAKLVASTEYAAPTPEVVTLTQPLRGSFSTVTTTSATSSITEKEAVDGEVPSALVGASINDRLVSLQKNGEEGWRSRVHKDEDLLSPKKTRTKVPRPTSLLERVTQLESSSQQWKGRVTETDATRFTVAHKMASASSVPSLTVSSSLVEETTRSYRASGMSEMIGPSQAGLLASPASERKKRSPLPKVFKSKTGSCLPDVLSKDLPSEDPPKAFARSISIPSTGTDTNEEAEYATIVIPRPDDESFNAFFVSSSPTSHAHEGEDSTEYDASAFDHIASHTSRLAVKRRSVRAARTKRSSGNPLKSLAQREDIKAEYTQITLGIGERELRRMKVEELSKSSSLAMEALAGLASKENFSAVALKRVEDNPIVRELAPYSDLMLVQVKGRRHPQVRLVQPRCQSVNQGDDFLLITPHELFHYKGPFANVIERAVASEMALYILQTKDMGVTSALKVTDVDETSPTAKKERFWAKLGGSSESKGLPPGPSDGDDHIEASLIASNKVFEVQGQSIVPLEGAWGQSPKYELLSSDKVLVFDFGSEVYIWTGKRATPEEKRQGTVLVKELWKEEVDYSDCDVNPTCPPIILGERTPMAGPRPRWGICGKITENVETILFKEKFVDWPDTAQQSRIKEVRSEAELKCDPVCELEPCDVNDMITSRPLEPDLVLEMSHLGRGVVYYDEEERRLHNISTNDFKVWHISENEKREMNGSVVCHFYSGETYVVRWYYHVTATGRTLKGTPSRHNVTGRSRVAYFFWQGQSSSISDKGVSALMTVELDEERGPHVRVTMGAEPPAFLNLFEGALVVHEGKRDVVRDDPGGTAKLFVVRGNFPNEAHLVEIEVSPRHMRSRGCVVLANLDAGKIHFWTGSKVTAHSKEVGMTAAKRLCESPAKAMGWRGHKRRTTPPSSSPCSIELQEEPEGRESAEFLSLLGKNHVGSCDYFSLSNEVDAPFDWTTRVWKLEAKADAFQPQEIVSSYRATERVCAFPLWQQELYSTDQPVLFLIDAGLKVYIWQGWFPEGGDEEVCVSVTGSAYLRFAFARRAALQTALHFVRRKEMMIKKDVFKNGSFTIADCAALLNPKLVVAGMESLEFTNLFPIWTEHKEVIEIQEKEGRWIRGEEYCVRDVLEQLCRERYTLQELQMVPLPDGVDPSRLEKYLSDEEFRETLGVTKYEFLSLPSWKQLQLKKKGNLF